MPRRRPVEHDLPGLRPAAGGLSRVAAPQAEGRKPQAGTVVLGLGNPLRGDDGAGLRVAEEIEALLRDRPIPGVAVRTTARAGLEVIELLSGCARAVVIDCLEAPDPTPGRVRRLTLAACPGSARLVGAHDLSLGDTFALARATGHSMPEEVEIYGIEAAETLAIREGLSPAVAAAASALAAEIYGRLHAVNSPESRVQSQSTVQGSIVGPSTIDAGRTVGPSTIDAGRTVGPSTIDAGRTVGLSTIDP
jgi:hydrogenase maturation protease